MATGVMGRAIGRHLQDIQGRHYVQFPVALRQEAEALVVACNAGRPEHRALLVAADRPAGAPSWTIEADELLAWRTDEDRVFVLLGSAVEPDSSFATATSAYITGAFPGAGGGQCAPADFARLGVSEGLGRLAAEEDVRVAFEGCAPWVFELLSRAVQHDGIEGSPWTEQVLGIWAGVLSDLEDACLQVGAGLGRSALEPADAWELVRWAGMPKPDVGGLGQAVPPAAADVLDRDLQGTVGIWSEFIDGFLRPGDFAVVLDRLGDMSSVDGRARWRSLPWQGAQDKALGFRDSAPAIGRFLFRDAAGARFTDPGEALADRWQAVSATELAAAMSAARSGGSMLAVPAGGGFLALGKGRYLLDVRAKATGSQIKGRTAQVALAGFQLEVRGWPGGATSDAGAVAEAGALIDGDPVVRVVPSAHLKVAVAQWSTQGGVLRIDLDAAITRSLRTDKSARWATRRKLVVELRVRDKVGGQLQAPRELVLTEDLVAPSPYWPTIACLDGDRLVATSPHASTDFEPPPEDGSPSGGAVETPNLEVDKPRRARIVGYDGRWDPSTLAHAAPACFTYQGVDLPSGPRTGFDADAVVSLVDEAVIGIEGDATDVAVVRIEDARPLPTNPLRRQEAGDPLGEPSLAARNTPLGRYQGQVARTLLQGSSAATDEVAAFDPVEGKEASPEAVAEGTGGAGQAPVQSLFQLVIPSGAGEIPSEIAFGQLPASAMPTGDPWPGIGRGPSDSLASTPAWSTFASLSAEVAGHVLSGGVADWLSAAEATKAPASLVKRYLAAHKALVEAASSPEDKFWARYPFSVFVLNSVRGPERGTLQAIFLSPFHPARLGWLYAAQAHASALGLGSSLLGLLDGWNLPALGEAPGPGGVPIRLVALPLEPGEDGDNASWSALVATSQHGVVQSLPFAAGAQLPWGGRSGLSEKVVLQALDDYAGAHPFLTSIQVELRSAVEAPRSAEVDRAVLSWLVRELPEMGGAARVLDSSKRQGASPTRDAYSAQRSSLEPGSFSWIVRNGDEPLQATVDIAFVENAAPFIQHVPGRNIAPAPALPVRRFPTVIEHGSNVDYHHLCQGDDLLGLASLLSRIEPATNATRVVTTPDSLQAEAGVRWEVIGDINLEPMQMARLASSAGIGKQLWEWRPGWISGAGASIGTGRGAHYVLARVPRSLTAGLERRVGLSEAQARELVAELGSRGIGIATLRHPGTTQEAEAAGLFYAARLLAGFAGSPLPPQWMPDDGTFASGLLPLDPLQAVLAGLAEGTQDRRADLALVVVDLREPECPCIRVTPIESKHRTPNGPSAVDPTQGERRSAVDQAIASRTLLGTFADSLAEEVPPDRAAALQQLLRASGKLQAFANLVDLALKFGLEAPHPTDRALLMQRILDGQFCLQVGQGLVIWTVPGQPGASIEPGTAKVHEAEGVAEVTCNTLSAASLVWAGQAPDERQRHFRAELDRFFERILLPQPAGARPILDLRARLSAALGLDGRATGSTPDGGPGQPPQGSGDAAGAGEGSIAGTGGPTLPGDLPSGDPCEAAQVAPVPFGGLPAAPPEGSPTRPDGGTAGSPVPRLPASGSTPARADAIVGSEASARYTVLGKLANSGQVVGLDLDHPKAIGIFGYMGSGKSYLLGSIVEGAATSLPGLNELEAPLAVVVFNYRRNAADRFELSSLSSPNEEPDDLRRLDSDYGASAAALPDVHVLCLPGELRGREEEYAGTTASELFFDPASLDVEDWELLMGEPGGEAVFARETRSILQELRHSPQGISVEQVRELLSERLSRGSFAAAELRLRPIERLVSAERGVDFGSILKPGRVLTIDLRQPMFSRADAMKLILVCANQVAKQKTAFNKLVVFDEAHEYMTEAFGERFDARIRYMRHEGSSYIFATQDVGSIPAEIRRHLGIQFVFSLETRDNIADMQRVAPEFAGTDLQHLEAGTCLIRSARSTDGLFNVPKLLRVRPRATQHGGRSRIFRSAKA